MILTMNFLEAIPVHPDAKSYVVAFLPIIAMALALVINAAINREPM